MATRTIKASDRSGALVGTVIVPDRPQRALWPKTITIGWECLVDGCASEAGYGTTAWDAYAALVGHLKTGHAVEVSTRALASNLSLLSRCDQ